MSLSSTIRTDPKTLVGVLGAAGKVPGMFGPRGDFVTRSSNGCERGVYFIGVTSSTGGNAIRVQHVARDVRLGHEGCLALTPAKRGTQTAVTMDLRAFTTDIRAR